VLLLRLCSFIRVLTRPGIWLLNKLSSAFLTLADSRAKSPPSNLGNSSILERKTDISAGRFDHCLFAAHAFVLISLCCSGLLYLLWSVRDLIKDSALWFSGAVPGRNSYR